MACLMGSVMYCVVWQVCLTVVLASSKCTKDIVLSDEMHGKALVNHTVQTVLDIDNDGCQLYCFMDDRCISYNFYQQLGICNLSNSDHIMHPGHMVDTPNALYYRVKNNCGCNSSNMAGCKFNHSVCTHRCQCKPGFYGDNCAADVKSCKDIYSKTRRRKNKAYTIIIDGKPTKIYCNLKNDTCESGGWTLVMKIDGSKNDFTYNSALWSNKESYNLTAGQSGFDNYQTKMPSYWAMPFQKLCVGMKVNNVLKWAAISYSASSLYDVIADGRFRALSITKATWLSLIDSSSLQLNCNEEGFNIDRHARIGIRSNQENHCRSCDSNLGFGLNKPSLSCGNSCRLTCSNGNKYTVAFGYIMIK